MCGTFGAQTLAFALYLGGSLATGGDAGAVLGDVASARLPVGLLLPSAWLGLLVAAGLAAAFHAWGGEDPLAGWRSGWRALGLDIAAGLALGLASMIAVAAVDFALGWSAWTAPDLGPALVGLGWMIAVLVPAAAAEEVIFRGYVLRTLENWRGWTLGFVVSSVLFGLAHSLNPNVSALPLINIVLAGAALALAYRVSGGRLWLPIAYHFMWNYAQGPLLGFPVSGLGDFQAGLTATTTGPALWTGGAFGPEGGLAATAILLATCAGLWAWRRAQ